MAKYTVQIVTIKNGENIPGIIKLLPLTKMVSSLENIFVEILIIFFIHMSKILLHNSKNNSEEVLK